MASCSLPLAGCMSCREALSALPADEATALVAILDRPAA
jgi:hypothetical protein